MDNKLKSKLGLYWAPWHVSSDDEPFFEAFSPPVIKIMSTSAETAPYIDIAIRHANLVIVRSHPISEMRGDFGKKPPEDIAAEHARLILAMASTIKAQYGLNEAQMQRLAFEGLNEPKVWTGEENPRAIARYYETLVRLLGQENIRCVALNLGVGWPGNNNVPDAPPDWTPYESLVQAIVENDGFLGLHEYGGINGPQEAWGWWLGRWKFCPWDVPIIITEFGIDTGVYPGHQNLGWKTLMTKGMSFDQAASEYAANFCGWYDQQLQHDTRVVGATIFLYDYQNKEWETFDIREQAVREKLLAHKAWIENRTLGQIETESELPPHRIDVAWYIPPFSNAKEPSPGQEIPPDEGLPWWRKLLQHVRRAVCKRLCACQEE